jgi:hypothetical protein
MIRTRSFGLAVAAGREKAPGITGAVRSAGLRLTCRRIERLELPGFKSEPRSGLTFNAPLVMLSDCDSEQDGLALLTGEHRSGHYTRSFWRNPVTEIASAKRGPRRL